MPQTISSRGHGTARSAGRSSTNRVSNRGGIHKHNGAVRVDRDGDLVMRGATPARGDTATARGSSNGRGGRNQRRGNDFPSSRGPSRHAKSGIDPAALQTIARTLGMNDPPKGPRNSFRRGRDSDHTARKGLDEISIVGIKESKAARNDDGGSSSFISWLEFKANKNVPERDAVKIIKSRFEGDALMISVRPEDTPKVIRFSGFTFAGSVLSVEAVAKASSPRSSPRQSNAGLGNMSEAGLETIEMLRRVLERRYNPVSKFLDLSGLGKDAELKQVGMFDTTSRGSKFFAALMKVCDDMLPEPQLREQEIVSVSLADNALTNVSFVTTLAQTFPALRNLDLSHNKINNPTALNSWRWKFRKLDHLILSGNPIETEVSSYRHDILKWFPALTKINGIQMRSPEEVEAALKGKLPLPILPGCLRDETSTGQDFIKYFFPAYDRDRSSLVNDFYDSQSTFSLCVNTSAPHAPESAGQQKVGWDQYIKRSRNLKKISQLPAKMKRLHTGTEDIREALTTLPATRHPDLMDEPQKWCIECHTIPGLPDVTGQSPNGVAGLMVTIHGEFTEVDVYTGQGTTKRSFDRTLILGPGGRVGGVRVSSDLLVVRSYGGHDAWKPDVGAMGGPAHLTALHQLPIPTPNAGFAMPGFGKSEEQVQKEMLILDMSQRTGMVLEASKMCLEQYGWSMDGGMNGFNAAKSTLPPQAFLVSN